MILITTYLNNKKIHQFLTVDKKQVNQFLSSFNKQKEFDLEDLSIDDIDNNYSMVGFFKQNTIMVEGHRLDVSLNRSEIKIDYDKVNRILKDVKKLK